MSEMENSEIIDRLEAERDAYRAVVEKLITARTGDGLSFTVAFDAYRMAEDIYRVIHRVDGAPVEMIRKLARTDRPR